MSREIKNNNTEWRLCEQEEHGKFIYRIEFHKEDGEFLEDGYHLVVARNLGGKGFAIPSSTRMTTTLLVACSRRSEKKFNEAIEYLNDDLDWELNSCIDYIVNFKENNIKDKMVVEQKNKVEKRKLTFNDLVGMKEVKDKLSDVIDQLNNKEKYEEWGIEPIKGMILHGVGGTGKSMISEALAGEIDAEFIKVSTADIMSKYVGDSQKNVKSIFEKARSFEKSIILFDEADGMLGKRKADGENKEHNNTLNEFLFQLASRDNDNIFIIATTNRIDVMDEAVKRSGRFDYKIEVPLPDYETRKGILELNCKKKPLADNVDLGKIAKNMSGMNCADCNLLINESARKALKEKKDKIYQEDIEETFEIMICGLKSETKRLDDKTKKIVATHEVGHLLANELLDVNKTKKISILPRGNTLGFLLHANEEGEDVFLHNREELEDRIKVMLGGRASEEIFFGRATTGASDDLQKANNLIRQMITKYGYSDELGLLVIDDNSMQDKINSIVKESLERLYIETKELLNQHKELAKTLIDELIEKEELNGEQVEEIIKDYYSIAIENN